MQGTNLIPIFLTGLITGGLTCMAVQGGLLAATIAQRQEERLKEKLSNKGDAIPILSFLVAKLVSYTLLGLLLGLFGSFFQMSVFTRGVLNISVAIFMIGVGLNILNVHPIFRYFIIQPPHFLTRFIRKRSKSGDIFAPAVLGAFTIFIPCGTTQAMMALAVGSASPILGAAILFAFVLGTSPLFFILGYFATKLSENLHQKFMRFAAIAILVLAIFNINNSLPFVGVNFDITKAPSRAYCLITACFLDSKIAAQDQAINNSSIQIKSLGYFPNQLTVKKGSDVKLTLTNIDGAGCVQAFTIPSLGIQQIVPPGNTQTITFKAPNQAGDIPFMCSMGMFRGNIKVI